MSRPKMTRRIGLLASLAVLVGGVVGCSVDTPTAPDQVPAPPPTVGGDNWNISVSVNPDSLVVGSGEPATVEVDVRSRADGSRPPNGTTMSVSTTIGFLGAQGSEVQTVGVVLDRGRTSTVLFAGSVASTGTVTARLEGSRGSDEVQVLSSIDPFILNVSPSEGPESGGTVVTITGVGFSPNSRVFFGSKLGTVTSTSSEQITVITPAADIPVQPCDSNGDGNENGQIKQDQSVTVSVESANGGIESLANAFIYRVAQSGVCVPN